MVKAITYFIAVAGLLTSCRSDKKCTKPVQMSFGARQWFTAVETRFKFDATTKDTLTDTFNAYLNEQETADYDDFFDEAPCPEIRFIMRTMVYKAMKSRDNVSISVSGPDNDIRCTVITSSNKAGYNYGYTFHINDPATLHSFNESYSNRGRFIGDTTIEGKQFPDVYVITPPTGTGLGYNKEMYISKTFGLLAWKIEGEHDWSLNLD